MAHELDDAPARLAAVAVRHAQVLVLLGVALGGLDAAPPVHPLGVEDPQLDERCWLARVEGAENRSRSFAGRLTVAVSSSSTFSPKSPSQSRVSSRGSGTRVARYRSGPARISADGLPADSGLRHSRGPPTR